MRRIPRAVVAVVILALVVVGCAGQEASGERPLAIVLNSPGTLVPGEVRLLVALIDQAGDPIAAPDLEAKVQLVNPETGEAESTATAEFVWTVPDARGLYAARVNAPKPGVWSVVVVADGFEPSDPVAAQIVDEAIVPVAGVGAPRSATPTGAQFDLADISSDPTPNPQFYESSLDGVIGTGTPVVVVFATPALCTSAACGPMLDVVDGVASGFPQVEFVHVEVYTNLDAQDGEPLEVAPSITEWGLPSEPWVFVVNGAGVVSAAFEGVIGAEELRAAIAVVTG